MGYDAGTHAQDASKGRVGEVLNSITSTAARVGSFSALDVAVAYATAGGVRLLVHELAALPAWAASRKRWLVSIDFGITQPSALRALASLPHSEVRIPNGRQVATTRMLRPTNTFHAKGYLLRGASWSAPLGLVIGSANLSVSALATGSEVVISQVWTGQLSGPETALLDQAHPLLEWFEDAWGGADALKDVLNDYKASRRRAGIPRRPPEDRGRLARAAIKPADGHVVHGSLAVQLTAARALWFETGHLYVNLPQRGVGNQLDTPRGTRVFFGFSSAIKNPNTVLGHVELQVVGYSPVDRTVRFADNFMDKVNLPLPGSDGPPTYDNSILIFERDGTTADGRDRFRLVVTDSAGLAVRKASANNSVDLQMQGGREYGLLF